MPDNLSEEQVKDALKEAFREWLEAKYAEVGRWTIAGIAAALFAAGIWAAMTAAGWHR